MTSVRYHAVVAFGVTVDGALAPVVEEAAGSLEEAVLLARRLGKAYAGAIAFSRTMDMGQGRYGLAKVHAMEGLVPRDLALMLGQRRQMTQHSQSADTCRIVSTSRSLTERASVVVRPARWRR